MVDDVERLARRKYVTVILRLLVERGGHLVEGQVIDVAGAVRGRFGEWRGLVPKVRKVLEHDDRGADV